MRFIFNTATTDDWFCGKHGKYLVAARGLGFGWWIAQADWYNLMNL